MEKTPAYSPIHLRSCYSLLRGCLSPDHLCRHAAEAGAPSVGMVDINNFYGIVRFLQAAKRWGVKPVCGVAIERGGEHLFTAYCLDMRGFARANGVITKLMYSRTGEAAGYDPVADLTEGGWEGLAIVSWSTGVLAKLACRSSRSLYTGLVYGRPFYRLARWGQGMGIAPMALNNGVYLDARGKQLYAILRAIDENVTVDALPPAELARQEMRIVSGAEMVRYFSALPDSLLQAHILAEEADCSAVLRDKYIFPGFRGFSDREAFNHLKALCMQGIGRRYGEIRKEILDRLTYELSIIGKKEFAPYFLVVHDIVSRWPRTCGRGSSAASIVSYLLGITHVDPLKHNLFFERFLNMGRKDPPDIDVDFPWDEREKALNYVFETYQGRSGMVADHVTFGPRSSLREPAKAMGLDPEEIDTMLMMKKHGRTEEIPPYLWRACTTLRGMPRHIGTHPGGVVITPGPITDYTHLQPSPLGVPVIAWEKDATEDAGLVKIDLLGNRSLAVLRDTLELINPILAEEKKGKIQWESFNPIADRLTRDMIEEGDTLGVFYVESPATRQLLKKMGRGDYEHLVIASSIIRPAANRYIKEFVRRLKGGAYAPHHPLVAETLKETRGIMVYQEDVARVAIAVAGFSAAEADMLRKILSKKDRNTRLEAYKERFFAGGSRRGVSGEVLERLWGMILSFDGYSFCKPHSASYALVSYRLAWMKRYYPLQFYVSVVNNGGGFYARQVYINALRRLGVPLLGPDVQISRYEYTVSGGAVRVGLGQLREIPLDFIELLIREREKKPFADFFDFVRRLNPSFAEIRILIRSGSLDSIRGGFTRPQLFWVFFHMERERALFDAPHVPECIGDYSETGKILDEVRTMDVLISCHPLEIVSSLAPPFQEPRLPLMIDSRSIASCVHLKVCIAGFLVAGKEVRTKNRKYMSFVSFDDPYSLFETVVFPNRYPDLSLKMEDGVMFLVVGTVQEDEGAYTLEVENLIPLSGKNRSGSVHLKYGHESGQQGEYQGSPVDNLLGHSRQPAAHSG